MLVLTQLAHTTLEKVTTLTASLACFGAMVTCVLWAVTISLNRVEQVNRLLPPEKKIGFVLVFIGAERDPRFEREYERLFPDHALRNKERKLWALGAFALIALAASFWPLASAFGF